MRNTPNPVPQDTRDPLEAELLPYANQGALDGRIVIADWAGAMPQQKAQIPAIRLGRWWINSLWFLAVGVVGLIVMIVVAQQLRAYPWMQDFIARYPGVSTSVVPVIDSGFPWWLRWQHFFNLVFIMFIIRAGLQILADHPRLYFDAGCLPGSEWFRMRGPVPPERMTSADAGQRWTSKDDSVALPSWLGIPGFRHSVGLARWFHFSFDLLWLINGVLFFSLLFASGEWQRLVPRSLDVFPNALSVAIQYASLDFPANTGFNQYNGLQVLVYFITLFIAAPLAFITGLLQAPAIAGKFGLGSGALNRQVARSVHFAVLSWMVFFILVHTIMVWTTGLIPNLNHITLGANTSSWWALVLYGTWMAVVVVLWLAASPFTIRYPRTVQRIGTTLVGGIKGLMEWWDPRATYKQSDISPYFWPNGDLPTSTEYERLLAGGFADYKLRIDGLVENPIELSYQTIKGLPKREQTTQHYCIQGWSGIAKWGGVAMADLLDIVRPLPTAKWVVFYSFAEGPETGRYYDAHRIENMRHQNTILAYEMNDQPLSELHGAPLRLRDELELGFKQVKWVEAVEFVESFERLGAGMGGYNEDQEFYGYRMPI